MSIEIVVADDLVAPVLSSPGGEGTGETTANLAVTTNKDNGTLYWIVTESATSPSVTQVQAGQDHTGSAAVSSGSQSVTVLGEQNVAATGLSTATPYFTHFTQVDVSANIANVASGSGFESGADETAPVLTDPSASATSASSASASVTTDEGNGTLYGVVTGSATAPSQAQVKAGQDHTGSAADWADSAPVFSVGTKTLTPTGLTAATTYFFHGMNEDATGNQSAVLSSTSFATWPSIPSAETFSASGTWTVPAAADYYTVTVKAYGGGGGGGGGGISSGYVAGNGGESRFDASTPLVAGGGIGGQGRDYGGGLGAGGAASGGSTNTTGNSGDNGTVTGDPDYGYAIGGAGGACPNGGTGGAQTGPTSGNDTGDAGSAPGGSGSGGVATGPGGGGGGGSGGYVSQSYAPGTFTVSGTVAVTVGVGGTAGSGWRTGGVGAGGRVTVEYT